MSNITREEALKILSNWARYGTDRSGQQKYSIDDLVSIINQQPTSKELEEVCSSCKGTGSNVFDVGGKCWDCQGQGYIPTPQASEIDELKGLTIKDKIKNATTFYTNENGVGMVQIQASKFYQMERELNAIREIVYGGYEREEIEDKIKSILGDDNNE